MRLLLNIACLMAATGCAGWFMTGESPEVLLINITPLETTAFEQRVQVDLRVRNPNPYDLHVTGMDVRLDVNGSRLARGVSNKEWSLPRLGEAAVSLETSTSTFDIVRQLIGLGTAQEVAYHVRGTLHLKEGKLPFENNGVILEKGALSDLPK